MWEYSIDKLGAGRSLRSQETDPADLQRIYMTLIRGIKDLDTKKISLLVKSAKRDGYWPEIESNLGKLLSSGEEQA